MKTTIPRVSGLNGVSEKRPQVGDRIGGNGVQVSASSLRALTAPFPYYGGKSRHAKEIWKRFGRPDVYAEPFAGSLAVLLGRANPCRREVVCDLDGHIANFWRAMQADPDEVARWADYPTIHQDLTARHRWLTAWCREHSARLSEDPFYYDARGRRLVGVGQVELDRQRMVSGQQSGQHADPRCTGECALGPRGTGSARWSSGDARAPDWRGRPGRARSDPVRELGTGWPDLQRRSGAAGPDPVDSTGRKQRGRGCSEQGCPRGHRDRGAPAAVVPRPSAANRPRHHPEPGVEVRRHAVHPVGHGE